jgi:dTMP kinase
MRLPPLVSFAGIDGSGKSTQVAAVARRLRDLGADVASSKTRLSATYSIFALSERLFDDPHAYHPGIPATLREFVIASDVVQHFHTEIAAQLAAGRTVVWDRGPLCYEAYARAYGASMEWVGPMLALVPQPDVTFLLDVDPDLAWERIRRRTEKPMLTSERPAFLATFRQSYLALARRHPGIVVLDAGREPDELTAAAIEHLMTLS